MINNNLENGEIQMQGTAVIATSSDLKQVVPLELSNIDTDSPNVLALGFDAKIMMEIVANSMYKDKTIALQELPANARDAIIRRAETGDIFTPEILINYNSVNHEISISDNGVGMTREVVESVYRFFGRSDKRNTLTEVGMFGVGSKTPFALVDEYEVSTISMLTHKKLSFIVTKRGIIIIEDEIPTDEKCGTTVKFTVPKDYSTYEIKDRIRRCVSTWLCPVYFIEDNASYREKMHHVTELPTPLSNIKDGYYKGFNESRLKYESEDFSFYLKNSGSSKIFIGHIPYHFEIVFPLNIDVIMYNSNLLTLTATREGLERDSKFNEFIKLVKQKILEILIPAFDKHFKNLQDMKNVDDMLFSFFRNFRDNNLLNQNNYPYFEILTNVYKYYSTYYHRTHTLYKIITENYNIYYTTKKLTSNTAETMLNRLPPNSAIITCPEYCDKFCLFCPSYNINFECENGKTPIFLLRDIAKSLPVFERKNPARKVRRQETFKGLNLYDQQTRKYTITDKEGLLITKDKIDTNFSNIIMVTEPIYKKLMKLGWRTISTEEYPEYVRNRLDFTTIEGDTIKAVDLRRHKTVLHGMRNYNKTILEVLKILYPRAIFITDFIDSKDIDTLKTPKQEFINRNNIDDILRKIDGELEIKLSMPFKELINFSFSLSENTAIKSIKRKV